MVVAFFVSLSSTEGWESQSISNILRDGFGFLRRADQVGSLQLVEDTVIWTIISYVVGHIVAYLSSVTVESYSRWLFGYPSSFLLRKAPPHLFWSVKRDEVPSEGIVSQSESRNSANSEGGGAVSSEETNGRVIFAIRSWRVIIAILLWPITVSYLLLRQIFRLKEFLTKPLDKTLRDAIRTNQDKLADSLGIVRRADDDFHRVITHYVYERLDRHAPKLDNYVALYGFLRALTLIMAGTTSWILIIIIRYSIHICRTSPKVEFDWSATGELVFFILLTFICFMGFMKFYRRYTLEGFMCLVIDDSFKKTLVIPYTFTHTVPDSTPIVDSPSTPTTTTTTTTQADWQTPPSSSPEPPELHDATPEEDE